MAALPSSATFLSEYAICSVYWRSRPNSRKLPKALKPAIKQSSFLEHRKAGNEPNDVAALFQNPMIQIAYEDLPKLVLLPRAWREREDPGGILLPRGRTWQRQS